MEQFECQSWVYSLCILEVVVILFFSRKYHNSMRKIISHQENVITLFLIQELYQNERKKMKFKIKDEDLVTRDLAEAIKRLPLEMRLASLEPEEMLKALKPEDRLKGLKKEELKKLKEILDKLNLN